MSETQTGGADADRYEWTARLQPALLSVLPLLLFVAAWSPQVWTWMGGLVSLVVTCGVTYFAARVARYFGRKVEADLIAKDGPLPSVRALRHRDTGIERQTKERYHSVLRAHKLHIPDADEERINASAADGHYLSASKFLIARTRDKPEFKLIAQENSDYGFRRNALGMRPIAIGILGVVILANGLVLCISYFETEGVNWAAAALEVFALIALAVWAFVIKLDFVRDAGESYAARLLAACDDPSVASGIQ